MRFRRRRVARHLFSILAESCMDPSLPAQLSYDTRKMSAQKVGCFVVTKGDCGAALSSSVRLWVDRQLAVMRPSTLFQALGEKKNT